MHLLAANLQDSRLHCVRTHMNERRLNTPFFCLTTCCMKWIWRVYIYIYIYICIYTGVLISASPTRKETSSEACQGRTRFQQHGDASRHQVFFSPCKARRRRKFTPFWQKACFLPGWAKDLSAPLCIYACMYRTCTLFVATSINKYYFVLRTAFLWICTQRVVVIPYLRFGTN